VTAKIGMVRLHRTYSQPPSMIVPARIRQPATKFIRAKLQTPATVQLADCM
jgi:hypothetical protein